MNYTIAMVGACPFPVPQGSQVLLRDVALSMREDGHDVHLVVYGYGKGEDKSGLPVHRCRKLPFSGKITAGPSFAKPILDMAMVAALRRVLKEQDIDIIHAHNYEGLMVALAARSISPRKDFPPIVYHTHNVMADELQYYFKAKSLARGFGTWLDCTFPKRSDHIIAHHRVLVDYLVKHGCSPDSISVIAPPVNVDLFDPCKIEDAMPPILYAGNLDAYQNLELLQSAVKMVRQEIQEVRLMISTSEKRQIDGAEMIYTPDFDTLRKVLSRDCVFACPRVSWSGYPIKLLNAMAAGNAVVACKNAAHPITNEQNGLIVPDNDIEAFAGALISLLRDSGVRRNLGTNARETMIKRHSPGRIASETEEIYSRLIKIIQF